MWWGEGMGFSASVDYDRDPDSGQGGGASGWELVSIPYFEAGYRIGVIQGLEVGAKLTTPGSLGLDAKYQFVDGEKFAAAVGLGAAYLRDGGVGGNSSSYNRFDLQVPLYLSYDVSDFFTVYAAPKYLLLVEFITRDEYSDGRTDWLHMGGGSGGVRIGETIGVFIEGSYLRAFEHEGFHVLQGNTSFYYSF